MKRSKIFLGVTTALLAVAGVVAALTPEKSGLVQ